MMSDADYATVPIFPLPEVVLFPRMILPLHIFEPRYRAMVGDLTEQEEPLLAIALLKPGYEELYHTPRAPIYDIAGIGRILVCERLDDGRFNLLLRGEGRVRLVEQPSERPYRMGRAYFVPGFASASKEKLTALRRDLRETVTSFTAAEPELREQWIGLFDTSLRVAEIVDVIAGGLRVEPALRQCVLEETEAGARVELLLTLMRDVQAVAEQRRKIHDVDGSNLN